MTDQLVHIYIYNDTDTSEQIFKLLLGAGILGENAKEINYE